MNGEGSENNDEDPVDDDVEEDVIGLFNIFNKPKKRQGLKTVLATDSVQIITDKEEQKMYDDKLEEMRIYIPSLRILMAKYVKESKSEEQSPSNNEPASFLKKLNTLHDILITRRKKIKYSCLLKCEKILRNFDRIIRPRTIGTGSPGGEDAVTENLLTPAPNIDSSPKPSTSRALEPVPSTSRAAMEDRRHPSMTQKESVWPPFSGKPGTSKTEKESKSKNDKSSTETKQQNPLKKKPVSRKPPSPTGFGNNSTTERLFTPDPVVRRTRPVDQNQVKTVSNNTMKQSKPSQRKPPSPVVFGNCSTSEKLFTPDPIVKRPRPVDKDQMNDKSANLISEKNKQLPSQRRRSPVVQDPTPNPPERQVVMRQRISWNPERPISQTSGDLRDSLEARRRSCEEIKVVRYLKTSPKNTKLIQAEVRKSMNQDKSKASTSFTSSYLGFATSSLASIGNIDNEGDNQKDEDTLSLEKSQRQLEALMHNRLENMQAHKITLPTSREKPRQEVPNELTSENISSTLDEVMSNLRSKFNLNRCPSKTPQKQWDNRERHSADSVPLPENNSPRICQPIFSAADKADVQKIVSEILQENKIIVSSSSKPVAVSSTSAINNNNFSENVLTTPIYIDDDINFLRKGVWKNDGEGSEVVIPGLDGVIAPVLRNSVTYREGREVNQTKERSQITKENLTSPESQSNPKYSIDSATSKPIPNDLDMKPDDKNSKSSAPRASFQIPGENLADSESLNELGQRKIHSDLNECDTRKPISRAGEEAENAKLNKSVRSKLSNEISTLHKVGTPCGGALRGLVKRDKMMPSGQIASLKPGTLIDLINEDKPQRPSSKQKNKHYIQQNVGSDISANLNMSDQLKMPVNSNESKNSCTTIKPKNANEILSQLSENDLKKLITENIGALPTPPNLPFFNNVVSTNSNIQISNPSTMNQLATWSSKSDMQQINLHGQNVVINNINITPTKYNDMSVNAIMNKQSGPMWGMPNQVGDAWQNKNAPADPRREPQNLLTSNMALNSQHNIEGRQNTFGNVPDMQVYSFENPPYISASANNLQQFKCNERDTSRELFNFNSYNKNPSVVLQTDPFRSPCYDGSSTPDPYRPDPYTLSLSETFEKNESGYNKSSTSVYPRPSLLGEPINTYDREMQSRPPPQQQRPQILGTPPPPQQRPTLLGTPPLQQRPPVLGTPPLPEREFYQNVCESQQLRFGDPRNSRSVPTTYAAWKAEKNVSDNRKYNNFQARDGPNYYDRNPEDRRNYGSRYRWVKDASNLYPYDQRGREYDNICVKDTSTFRPLNREPDCPKKLSARDPRRKSIEDNSERNVISPKPTSSIESHGSDRDWSFRREPRVRERAPPRERSRSRDQGRYGSRDRSLSRGRKRSPSQRRSNDAFNKNYRNDNNSKDTYSSPLDCLYTNESTPKTGLGYGVQKFRIPKLNKVSVDRSIKHKSKDSNNRKDDFEDSQSSKKLLSDESSKDYLKKESFDQSKESQDNFDSTEDSNTVLEINENIQINSTTRENQEGSEIKDNEEPKSSENDIELKEELLVAKEKDNHLTCSSKSKNKAVKTEKDKTEVLSIEVEEKNSPCRKSTRLSYSQKTSKSSRILHENEVDESSSNSDLPNENSSAISNDSAIGDEKKTESSESYKGVPSDSVTETRELLVDSKTVSTLPLQRSDALDDMHQNTVDNTNQEHAHKGGSQENEDVIDLSMKKNIDDINAEHRQLSPVIESSEVPTCNSTVVLDKGPDVNIIEHVFQQFNMLGVKLTPNKIKQMAEILRKEEQDEPKGQGVNKIPDEDINVISSSDQNSGGFPRIMDENNTYSTKDRPSNESEVNTSVKETDQSDLIPINNMENKGDRNVKPIKSKTYKKKKKTKLKPQVSKKDSDENKSTPPQKRPRKYKNELDRLQDDISKYHDSEAIAAASGPRQCRLQKEKNSQVVVVNSQISSNKKKRNKYISKKYQEEDDSEKEQDDVSIQEEEDESDKEELDDKSIQDHEEGSLKEEDGRAKEEFFEYGSDSSENDPISLYSEKIKSKYKPYITEGKTKENKHVPQEPKSQSNFASNFQEIRTVSGKNNKTKDCSHPNDNVESESTLLSVNHKVKGQEKPTSKGNLIENEVTSDDNEVSLNSDFSVHQKKASKPDSNIDNIELKDSREQSENIVSSSESTTKGFSEDVHDSSEGSENDEKNECYLEKEPLPNKVISNNILHKYGIRRQRKKSFWSAGIIRKKTKGKKSENFASSNDNDLVDSYEMEDSEDAMDVELPDINYYQEGESKASKCKLCSYNGKSIVTHYAITHPKDEVFISRMSPKAAEEAIKESEIFFNLNDEKKKKYSSTFECRICYLKFTKFSKFFEHMALHTGEFRHECCKCGYRTSTRSGILKHYLTHNVKNTNTKSCRILYKEPLDKTYFSGYLCSLCNYFQISQSSLKRHVENIHEEQDFGSIVKINFSKITFDDFDESIRGEGTNVLSEEKIAIHSDDGGKKTVLEKSPKSTMNPLHSVPEELPLSEDKLSSESSDTCQVDDRDKQTIFSSESSVPKTPECNRDQSDCISSSDNPDASVSLPDRLEDASEKSVTQDDDNLSLKEVEVLNTTQEEPEKEVIEKGVFDPSPELANHIQFISEETRNSYKQKCIEATAHMSLKINKNCNKRVMDNLMAKMSLLESDSNDVLELKSLICNKRKSVSHPPVNKSPEKAAQELVEDEVVPPRRHLPDRSCKGGVLKPKQSENETDIIIEEENYVDSFRDLDDVSYDVNIKDEETSLVQENIVDKVCPMLNAVIEWCKKVVNSEMSYEPEKKVYVSSLPVNSNLSEFTHVMKQLSQVTLKSSEINEVVVGGLKVLPMLTGVIFSCYVKIFNKECGFQTPSLETFGQHINRSHHNSPWEGTCGTCKAVFIQDSTSHDKASINTQSRAFCHLVREHLTFVKKSSKTGMRGNTSHNEVNTSEEPPRLRVRRLSGDILSRHSVPGTENSLVTPPPTESNDQSLLSSLQYLPPQSDQAIPNSLEVLSPSQTSQQTEEMDSTPLLSEDETNRGVKVFSTKHLQESAVSTFKVTKIYQVMCSHDKLRDFYKCMGARCSFTTMNFKEFARHFEEHKDIHVMNPKGDPHRGFWRVCAYCLSPHSSSREMCIHIRKEHGECTLQCAYCFYRAKSVANVFFHHSVEHDDCEFLVLQCEQGEQNLPPYVEKSFSEFVSAFRCNKRGCNLYTYMLETFCKHQLEVHPEDLRCHLCMLAYSHVSSLINHYRVVHGIGLFQCLFCIHGTMTEHEMRLHLCYVHPSTDPKAIHRTNNVRNHPGTVPNTESLRRVMFFKDQDKLLKYIIPPPQNILEPSVYTSCLNPNPEVSDRCATEQTAATLSTLGIPRPSVRPNILRAREGTTKRSLPYETHQSPSKVFVMNSHDNSSPGGVKMVPIRVMFPGMVPVTQCSSSSISHQMNLMTSFPTNPSISATVTITVPTTSIKTSVSNIIDEWSDNASSEDTVVHNDSSVVNLSSLSSSALNLCESSKDNTAIECSSVSGVLNTSLPSRDNLSTENVTSTSSDVTVVNTSLSGQTTNLVTDNDQENYFKCGNKGCNFQSRTSIQLRNHLVICDEARQSQKLMCAFCKRFFKQGSSLIEHLRIHGPSRYSCSVCLFKAPVVSRVTAHMKLSHHIHTTIVTPVDPQKQDNETDFFVVSPKEKRNRTNEKIGPKGKGRNEEVKTKFSPNELEQVPKTAIFQNSLGCSICSYETKVRSNLIRHITQHSSSENVSQEEFVNPVPEKTEKMFDKMMNLAGSSHKKKSSQDQQGEDVEVECQYKYVADHFRYMCHLKECGYRTLTESMLRDHISVIHKDEHFYLCPHCSEVDPPVPIDQLGLHLKLHDSPVFKCSYCSYHSHIRRSIERHQQVNHSGEPLAVIVVRLTKPDQQSNEPVRRPQSTDQSEEQGEDWYCCNICSFRTKKKKMILQHGINKHQMAKPFRCSVCDYESLSENIFNSHFKTYHAEEYSCEVISLYKKVTEMKRPVLPPIPPLWKRDAKRLKLIRGIKLDEKGDAPPPVATCVSGDVNNLDFLELKFGYFGRPDSSGAFVCPRCSTFTCKNRQEMREHLYKDLDYKPFTCKICKISSTQKTKIMKHVNKTHGIDWERVADMMETNILREFENWVEKGLTKQQELMKELTSSEQSVSPPPSKKRRKSWIEMSVLPEKVTESQEEGLLSVSSNDSTTPTVASRDFIEDPAIPIANSGAPPSSQEAISVSGSGEGDDTKRLERGRRKRDKCPSRHRFGCEYCDITTKYKHSIVLHSRKMHPNDPPKIITLAKSPIDDKTDAFNCMFCNCTALNLNNLKYHWTIIHKISGLNFMFRKTIIHTELEYECFWCKKRSDLENLEEHCNEDHPDQRFLVVSVTVPKYKCSECKLVFNSVDILKRHFSMDHPAKQFCYIVVNAKRPVSSPSDKTLPFSSNQSEKSLQSKINSMYKCFNCHFVSPKFWLMVKHMHRHFVTYVCTECEKLYPSALGIRSHLLSKHPGSNKKPLILKGSERDIENAKKNIIILESGRKRKITEQELAEAEKEVKTEEHSSEMYSYDEPSQVNTNLPTVKETARKSTGSPKSRSISPRPSTQETQNTPCIPKKTLFKIRKKKLSLSDTFVNVRSHGKIIKLPLDIFKKLNNFDAEISLSHIEDEEILEEM